VNDAGGHADLTAGLDGLLVEADAAVARRRTLPDARFPIHTCYVPADAYTAATIGEWGEQARQVLAAHAEHPELPDVLGLTPQLLAEVLPRAQAMLELRPVQDLRIDFEDGYGLRSDAEEDTHAALAATALAATRDRTGWAGLRVRSMEAATRQRAVRTLAGFLAALQAAGGDPTGLIVTLPKVSHPDQVRAMSVICFRLEARHNLPPGTLRLEVQIELPAAVLAADGTAPAGAFIDAAGGRCDGLHFGTYDYSAALGIDPAEQRADHPAAEHAKAVLQLAAAGRGVRVVDGSSNVLPIGSAVLDAWRIQARIVRRALVLGITQGWDLHPAQLPCRYLVTLGHLRSGVPTACARLSAYRSRAAGGFLDEPATEAALRGFLDRALVLGAMDPDEAPRPPERVHSGPTAIHGGPNAETTVS
jgi:citrate lyase beta subunit